MMRWAVIAALGWLMVSCNDTDGARFKLRVEGEGVADRVAVIPLNHAASAVMKDLRRDGANGLVTVRVVRSETDAEPGPALFGSESWERDRLDFTPAVPLADGKLYRITFDPGNTTLAPVVLHHQTNALPVKAPAVVEVFPQAAVLPANHLKFYVRFDQPMTQGDAYQHLQLMKADGSPVNGAFREVELWDPSGMVLTILLHPGRQKTGVNLNEEEGPVLHQGQSYRLRVASSWTARSGGCLGQDHDTAFRVGPPDHVQPVPQHWTINADRQRGSILIQFDEALDLSPGKNSTMDRLWVTDPAGEKLSARYAVQATEVKITVNRLAPGTYKLNIRTDIEDLAGNSIARPFELQADSQVSSVDETMMLPFEVK